MSGLTSPTMPTVDRLRTILHAALPGISPQSRAVLDRLAARGSRPEPPDRLAASVGLQNRHHLAWRLERDGLPCLEQVAGWVRVTWWTLLWEESHRSLSRTALSEFSDPAVYYRATKWTTGKMWSEVRDLGVNWVLREFQRQCQPPAVFPLGTKALAS